MPSEQRKIIEQKAEIANFLEQSNISQKNIKRLNKLVLSANREVSEQARAVLEVALFQSHKRRRFKNMARKHPELIKKLGEVGLIFPWFDEKESDFDFDGQPDFTVEYDYIEQGAFDDEGLLF